ncbi:MAG: L,D-transpeptidase family protein [Gammaproteobacteria bacterium]
MRRVALLTLIVLCVWAGGAAADGVPWEERHVPPLPDPVTEQLRLRVGRIGSGAVGDGDAETIAGREVLAALYAAREYRPLWTDAERRRQLLALVRSSAAEGLAPIDYHLEFLQRSVRESVDPDAGAVADRDVILTDALARLAHHLRYGKVDPFALDPHWNFDASTEEGDPVSDLRAALAADSLVDHFARQFGRGAPYHLLVDALARYRAIVAGGGWPPVPSGPTLRPGDRHARVAAIRARLAAEWPLPAAPDADFFDEGLEAAVRRFQQRYGLGVDGIAGRQTIAAMNVPAAGRVDQIRVNLERARWVLDQPRADYLIVNIAGFRTFLMNRDQIRWESSAVVGQPYRRTPVFRSRITHLVFNPTWTVPPVIMREDIVPEALVDPSAVTRRGLEVVGPGGEKLDPADVDWARYPGPGFPYRLVQPPGPRNALGQVKFMLPNPYAVYLHDTPSRDLFRRANRTFSSGCIRLERPLELATLLLDGANGWDEQAIEATLAGGRTKTVFLPQPVTAMILYWTAGMGTGGRFGFFPDVYQRDAAVLAALDTRFESALRPHRAIDAQGRLQRRMDDDRLRDSGYE